MKIYNLNEIVIKKIIEDIKNDNFIDYYKINYNYSLFCYYLTYNLQILIETQYYKDLVLHKSLTNQFDIIPKVIENKEKYNFILYKDIENNTFDLYNLMQQSFISIDIEIKDLENVIYSHVYKN